MSVRNHKKNNILKENDGVKQTSLLSFFSPLNKCSKISLTTEKRNAPLEKNDSTNIAKSSPEIEKLTIGTQDLHCSAFNELITQLENSSDDSIIEETPQRKNQFRNLDIKNGKRLRRTHTPGKFSEAFQQIDLYEDQQICKRLKLSQSPKKQTFNEKNPEPNKQDRNFSKNISPRNFYNYNPSPSKAKGDIDLEKDLEANKEDRNFPKNISPRRKLQSHNLSQSEAKGDTCSKKDVEVSEKDRSFFKNNSPCKLQNHNLSQSKAGSNDYLKKDSEANIEDIENLGDFFEEDWTMECTDEKSLDLNEWKYCIVKKVNQVNEGLMVDLQENVKKIGIPSSASCIVQGYWGDKMLECNDVISIKAYFDEALNVWRVDHSKGYIIKHPDVLMSTTSLVGSLFCQRRAVLNYLFPGLDSKNVSMLIGSLTHELLEQVLMQKLYTEEEIQSAAVKFMNKRRTLMQAYEYGMTSSDLQKELRHIVPEIVNFINTYILEKIEEKTWPGKILDTYSVEENFWTPCLGLKGKTDFIVKTENEGRTQVMPLELKTGRASNAIEHRGQIILYLMMMSEVGKNTDSGLLLYLKHNIMKEINPGVTERQGLVTHRNNLVDYFAANDQLTLSDNNLIIPSLPEPINHHSGCARCPYLTVCSVYLRHETEIKLTDKNPLKTLSVSALAHLAPRHIQYVLLWTSLLKLEEKERKKETVANISNIWQMPSEDRRRRGFCIDKLSVAGVEKLDSKYLYHMQCLQNDDFDFTQSGLTENDYIVISTDVRVAIVTGYVQSISKKSIYLKFDRELRSASNELYTVDRYSASEALLAFNTSNLFSLLENTDTAARIRRLIIDMEMPSSNSGISSNKLKGARSLLNNLNQYQKNAILRTLAAEEFHLIKGLPGTGKTATIATLIRVLVQLNHSVLVTSHTHSAVDNILLRLKNDLNFLRLGPSSRVHRELESYCENSLIEKKNIHTVEELEKLFNKMPVIAVTCMGCSHTLLSKRTFDYCIVDEATQVLQPSILKSLFVAKKFVLVGDPNQLPPVVQSREASQLGFSESLFVRLDRAEVTSTLHLQYRMNSQIMKLANIFAYENQLQCSRETVSDATIKITHHPKKAEKYPWLKMVISSDLKESIVFLNISKMSTGQTYSEYANQIEGDITFMIVEALIKDVEDIGIIAPYREQVKLLKKMATARRYEEIEINTVDQYQGRDKDVIIYSCTKHSNTKEGGILADKRRLTVAITRAKKKLIIIGNISILTKYLVFEELIRSIPKENVIDIMSL